MRHGNSWWIILAWIFFFAALIAFVLHDTPVEPENNALRIVVRYEAPPYPEEDTMHYVTEEGEVIVYAGENK